MAVPYDIVSRALKDIGALEADAPVDKAVWATYRQALRDVTAQSGFPWTITWPDAP